jgi:hypothetical protein
MAESDKQPIGQMVSLVLIPSISCMPRERGKKKKLGLQDETSCNDKMM